MTPEEAQEILSMFEKGEPITSAKLALRMNGGELKPSQREPARKLAWHKLRMMEDAGLIVKHDAPKGAPCTWEIMKG